MSRLSPKTLFGNGVVKNPFQTNPNKPFVKQPTLPTPLKILQNPFPKEMLTPTN